MLSAQGFRRGTQPQGADQREREARGEAPGTKRPRAHLDSFSWALQGALNPASRSPRLSPSPMRGVGKAALSRIFFLHPGSPPAPSLPAFIPGRRGRPQPRTPPSWPLPRAREGAPAGSPRRLTCQAAGAAAPLPAGSDCAPQPPCAQPCLRRSALRLLPPQTKGRCPRRGLGDRAGSLGRAGSGSVAAGRSSAAGAGLGDAPEGPQPGSTPHLSAGLG